MTRGPCPAIRLERALTASARAAGAPLAIAAHRAIPWHSVTFAGHRHVLEVSARSGEPLDRWLDALPEADLPVPGHLIADLSIGRHDRIGDLTHFRIDGVTVATD